MESKYRRINEIHYIGSGPNPIKDPRTCEHDWQPPRNRADADGWCPKCKHTSSWIENERDRPLAWWRAKREQSEAIRQLHPPTIEVRPSDDE